MSSNLGDGYGYGRERRKKIRKEICRVGKREIAKVREGWWGERGKQKE